MWSEINDSECIIKKVKAYFAFLYIFFSLQKEAYTREDRKKEKSTLCLKFNLPLLSNIY